MLIVIVIVTAPLILTSKHRKEAREYVSLYYFSITTELEAVSGILPYVDTLRPL